MSAVNGVTVAGRLGAVRELLRKALTQYVEVLAGKADMQGVDLNAAASPLVQ